jgi:hypothetical protein
MKKTNQTNNKINSKLTPPLQEITTEKLSYDILASSSRDAENIVE